MKHRMRQTLLLFLAVVMAAMSGCAGSEETKNASAFTAPPFEENAVSGTPAEVDEALNYSTLEIKDGFAVALCASLAVEEENQVEVYFTCEPENTVWVRLLLMTEEGEELGSTGILKPNEYVQTVTLDMVPENTGTILLKILSYEPDTYYSFGSASVRATLQL